MHSGPPGDRRLAIDWAAVVKGIESGEREALLHVSRLVTAALVRVRATDFRSEWPDLTQETLAAVVTAVRSGALESPAALPGYVQRVVRNKFSDRLRVHLRWSEDQQLPWNEQTEIAAFPGREPGAWEAGVDLRAALDRLPEAARSAVLDVYLRGFTYQEAADRARLPLGTLKDLLTRSLRSLRSSI